MEPANEEFMPGENGGDLVFVHLYSRFFSGLMK
jgi:hypothetical protein